MVSTAGCRDINADAVFAAMIANLLTFSGCLIARSSPSIPPSLRPRTQLDRRSRRSNKALRTEVSGGWHERRVRKIAAIEENLVKPEGPRLFVFNPVPAVHPDGAGPASRRDRPG
jgi:hypothetical protein